MRLAVTASLIMLSFSTSGSAYSSWLCVVDKSAGFAYRPDLHNWIAGAFTSNNKKYILREPTAAEVKRGITSKYVMLDFGTKFPSSYCQKDFNELGIIQCDGIHRLYFNKSNLRFQVTYETGYVVPFGEEGSDTPVMEIGLCSEI